ncbi:cysteinyl-tRNA synthetase protein (macronuclear) [Tetrahymena thermophila SB210]|uniref:cysteine--tRNA ligase n=1 Tax=Tetrahymena thermophila (strain SB210) TaxID=312017 RepID=I7LU51_TETTS|nr:cysteinyl-tRNA synthetase protein [Tetrahymena thermophila SB210]EAR89909.2 cysteinyl-tRNA synthetase protein [Tetrahymena thermophila SB210]|eukprot:XP_001010154.2 cysteinyl-tRNA synthetase protein [Tetrahymena thermophila SB210]
MIKQITNLTKTLKKRFLQVPKYPFGNSCCNKNLQIANLFSTNQKMTTEVKKDPYQLWQLPVKDETKYLTGLKVKNTLNPQNLVEFVPHKGKQVRFYNCGPTVYDSSHIGHARTYISADIIKRIMVKYFGYDVFHCMNITDIDDKIIKKSNESGEEFTAFARKWEMDYWQDMETLNVDKPDVIVRVSEYVPEIISYIEKIIENGYAYVANGSVYFNVDKFHESPTHCYSKLEPQSVNDAQKLDEGEGALGKKDEKEKRSPRDFALWKASKPGEPFWDSPWGQGRPGWHIECSTMASEILGYPVDIHMGGEDLKFPHHDNELAQSEAFYNKQDCQNQWVNYFMHTGHLHIDGLKMSKSLKNFITIKHLSSQHSQRVLRLLFMKQTYDSTMDYTTDSIHEAKTKDKKYSEFYLTMNAILLQSEINVPQKWGPREFELRDLFVEKQDNIHRAFQKNFNVPEALKELDEIITAVNTYIKEKPIIHLLIRSIFNYVKHIFNCLGLIYEKQQAQAKDDTFIRTVGLISSLRDEIRGANKDLQVINKAAINAKSSLGEITLKLEPNASESAVQIATDYITQVLKCVEDNQLQQIYKASDEIRDEKLIQIGIRIDDGKPGEPSLWKIDDKETLLKEKEEKILKEKQKEEEKRKKEEEKLKAMSVNPAEMFKNDPNYSKYQFDERGIPSHDEKGTPLKEKAIQSFVKKYDAQKKLYEQYLEKTSKK